MLDLRAYLRLGPVLRSLRFVNVVFIPISSLRTVLRPRRGFLNHLAVESSRRRAGIGRMLVERCLDALARRGMRKCHIFVVADNEDGKRFWRRMGWEERTTLVVMSHDVGLSPAGPARPMPAGAPGPAS